MADTVSNFVEKLSNLVIQEASVFGKVEGQMKLLRDEMKWMCLFLKDADSQCLFNEKMKLWVKQIRNVTFDAEDVIDEFTFHMDRRELRLSALGFLKCLPTWVGFVDKVPFMHQLASRLQDINLRIERIMANRTKYGLEPLMDSNSGFEVVAHKEKRPPIDEESDMVGIEDGTEEVKQMLTKGKARRAVVSIVGMGGLGKTTLAKKVYNHSDVKQQFNCRAWVAVSQEFKARETLLGIGNCVMSLSDEEKREMKEMEEIELGKKICEYLKDKKYLVVMDDVWRTEVWSSIGSYLPEAKDGSKVLITTRNEEIALHATSQEEIARAPQCSEEEIALHGTSQEEIARAPQCSEEEIASHATSQEEIVGAPLSSEEEIALHSTSLEETTRPSLSPEEESTVHVNFQSPIYRLRIMNDKESWKLFLKKTFGNRSPLGNLPSEMEKLGKNIVAKCKGLPLAIIVVGGVLSTKEKTKSSWKKVLAAIEWHLSQGPESCMGILALSYNDLPYYLKSCFLYFGIFPEDLEIKKSKLIHLWLAEGFIQRRGKEPLEDVAEDYLCELIHRSMVQAASRKEDGRVRSCRIHDLLRDLAISEARDAGLFQVLEVRDVAFPVRTRRLALHQQDVIKSNITRYLSESHLKSLVIFNETFERKSWGLLQGHMKLLNVLDLENTVDNYIVPNVIGELIHLRSLRIRGSKRVTLPSSIDKLVNLQCFDLDANAACISDSIWKLENLKWLHCRFGTISSRFKLGKSGVEKLTNLQELELQAGSWLDGDGLGKLTQLKKLKLRGRLMQHLTTGFFECVAKLTTLQNLCFLDAEAYKKKEMEAKTSFPGLLPISQHTNLRKLTLVLKLPDEIEFYAPNLLKLNLQWCRLRYDPMLMLGKLPNLRYLELFYHAYVGKKLVCPSGGFPQLQNLKLLALISLEELIVEERAMPLLRTLRIDICPNMNELPRALLQLKYLEKVEPQSMFDRLKKEVEEVEEDDEEVEEVEEDDEEVEEVEEDEEAETQNWPKIPCDDFFFPTVIVFSLCLIFFFFVIYMLW